MDRVGAGAAAVLGDVEGAAESAGFPGPAEEDDRVGVGEDVPLVDRQRQQVVEHDMGRRVEVEAADPAMVVGMGGDAVGVGAKLLAEELPGGPLILLAEDLVIEILEELELDRLREPL